MRKLTASKFLPKGRVAALLYMLLCALVALYSACVIVLWQKTPMSPALFALLCIACFALLCTLARGLGGAEIAVPQTPDALSARAFCSCALFCLSVMGVYFIAYYPGGISSDTISQWRQTQTLVLDDWHPALHTLLILLCSRVINHPAFALFVQMVCFALSVGYMSAVLLRWRFPRALRMSILLYVCLSPAVCNVMTFLWKDCAFAICALLLCVQLLEIHLSGGAWLGRALHLCALTLTLTLCAVLRHNGIALALAAALWLWVSFPRAFLRLGAAFAGVLVLLGLIKGPLYSHMQVQPQTQSVSETAGVPMAMLTHIYAERPDVLDEQTLSFLNGLAPHETFMAHDAVGDWNQMKWHVSLSGFEGYTLPQITGFALRAALQAPQQALEALNGLWRMAILPAGNAYWRLSPYVDTQSEFGFTQGGVPLLRRVLGALCRLSAKPPFAWAFWIPGFFTLAVMILCVLFARARPLSALLLPAGLIAYNLATTLVLSSPTDFRFYLFTPLCAPLCALALLARAPDAS